MSGIIGVTVGTPTSATKIEEEIKPVKTVNNKAPDAKGNVNIETSGGGIMAESDPTVPAWAKESSKPTYTAEEVGALPNTTKIPTKTSELTNDSGYAKTADHYTKTESDGKYQPKGNYLTSVPSEYVTETELNNKGYLTQHQSLAGYAKTSDIPTKTSQLTNDSKFISESSLDTAINSALAVAKESGAFDGEDGYTPVKGKDYFTEADKSEIISAVIAALPVYNGEVVEV